MLSAVIEVWAQLSESLPPGGEPKKSVSGQRGLEAAGRPDSGVDCVLSALELSGGPC